MNGAWLLLAQAADAAGQTVGKTTYKFSRLQPYDDERWHYLALFGICAAILAYVVWMYRRDSVELPRGLGIFLTALRIGALAAMLFFFLGLEKRTEQDVVHNSRVFLLVDTSISMSETDSDSTSVPASPSRIDQVVSALEEGSLIEGLRKTHDVTVLRFDQLTERVATLEKLTAKQIVANDRSEDAAEEPAAGDSEGEVSKPIAKIDWKEQLIPQGGETRIGEALKRLIDQERGTPVSAIVVVTDGQQNAGVQPSAAITAAKESQIPIYTVGLGTDKQSVNVGVEIAAPSRAYPGDNFGVTASVRSQGLSGRAVAVELYQRDADAKQGPGALVDTQRVTLGSDSDVIPITFQIASPEIGRKTYRVAVVPPKEDRDVADNHQEAEVEIVDRKTKVLLVASAATREFQFLRNQLHRDKEMIVDVWIQNAQPGISQDANEILDDFPIVAEELFKYDAIVAFDPDWSELTLSQVDLLERWVGEEAGGFIVVAGPVCTPEWVRSKDMSKIRNLYPVEFQQRFTLLSDADFGSKEAWPIEFTRAGEDAEFLWIGEDGVTSKSAWNEFSGVYGYYAVRGPKPAATVYGYYSDPKTQLGDEFPVYLAGQFYGAGRVFYLGSGEMWRLRSHDEKYFERIYTKLIRHVSQGRLLRGSTQGMLLIDRDRYQVGNTVLVRAQLSDAQHQPLDVPNVVLQVTQPDSTTQSISLAADATRKGLFSGQFTALQRGTYFLNLPVPGSLDEQITRSIKTTVPDLERQDVRRNDALLSEMATSTGGLYYIGLSSALSEGDGARPLVGQLRDRTETTTVAGAPDRIFQEHLSMWLLGIICGFLFLEWLIRRLSKLA